MRATFVLIAAAALTATGAAAATKTGQFAVRAQVVADCQITAQDMDFGTYASNAAANAQTPLNLKCTPGTGATLSLSAGSSGNPQTRTMKGPGNLNYQLFRDAAHQDPINTAGMAFQLDGAANDGSQKTFTVYGQTPANQAVPAGNYTDTIQVNVSY